jgi:hypothetical protein
MHASGKGKGDNKSVFVYLERGANLLRRYTIRLIVACSGWMGEPARELPCPESVQVLAVPKPSSPVKLLMVRFVDEGRRRPRCPV